MLKAYQGYHPGQIIRVFLPVLLFWLPAFLWPETFPQRIIFVAAPATPYLEPLTHLQGPLPALVAFFFWLITAYLLTALNHRYLFLRTRSLLPLFFLMTLTSPLTGITEINNLTLTLPFLVIVFFLVFRTYRNNQRDFSFFIAAFWTGVVALVSLKSSVFMIVIWIALLSLRPFYIREWLVSFLGFMTPWLLYFGTAFLLDHDPALLLRDALAGFSAGWPAYQPAPLQWVFLAYLAVLILAASVYNFLSLSAMKTRSRKFHMLFFWTALLAIASMAYFRCCWLSFFPFLGIPLSVLFAFYFAGEKAGWGKRILFDLYFVALIVLFIAGL